jgi:hypothetical protein
MKHPIQMILISLLLLCLSGLWASHPGMGRSYFETNPQSTESALPHHSYNIDRADTLLGFDITKYEISLNINDQTHQISGSVIAHVTSESNLTSMNYNLVGLTISEVRVNNTIITNYTHTGGIVSIPVSFSSGQSFTTQITYSGIPQLSSDVYHIGMIFGNNMIFTLSDPDAGRYWWPCYDHPWEKALVDLQITLRQDWLVACNGLRSSMVDNGNGTKTHTWLGSNPMPTYLVCFTAGPYVEINQTAGNIPIQNFVFPNQYNNALIDFATLPEILLYYQSVFGTYPFEKYGNAVVNMTTYGAMEHQTMTTLGQQYITGTHSGEITIAHELAHQWYGDCVTPLTFKDVWLSEGFATYAEALWIHERDGWAAACNYVNSSFHQFYLSYETSDPGAVIYDPSYSNYFSPPSYEKAASVLHMLRLKMGSANFFQLLQTWFGTYHNGHGITAEFQAMAEQISGLDLDQFFAQWIYQGGIPNVEFTIAQNHNSGQGMIVGRTTSSTQTQFTVEVPFTSPMAVGGDSLVFVASPEGYRNIYPLLNPGNSFINNNIDAHHWVLTRNQTEKNVVLSQCLGSNSAVLLTWESFANLPGMVGYKVYRRTAAQTLYTCITPAPLNVISYIDSQVQNGTQYFYQITAVDDTGFETLGSNSLSTTPVEFTFDWGMLLVDETRDGTGAAISPTDAMVDDFYAAALSPIAYTNWDYNVQGAPGINVLSHYPLVIWHADDFTQNNILNSLDALGSYLMGGGKLLLSGWKTPSVFSPAFTSLFLQNSTLVYDNGAALISAQSTEYPVLSPDPAKLSAVWNGMVPMVYTFEGAVNVLYTAQMTTGAAGNNLPVAARYDYPGVLVIFGFPLYCMQAEGVRSLLQQLIPELAPEVNTQDELIPEANFSLSCYPNPFTRTLSIHLQGKDNSRAKLAVYNAKGQKVCELQPDILYKGNSPLVWDGTDAAGKRLAPGIYIIRATLEKSTIIKKVLLYNQ